MHSTAQKQRERSTRRQHAREQTATLAQFFTGYFWFIVKNVVGWIFILGAFPLGVTVPGPGGLPIFLIGFALVTFPGKRKLTSRVMRGRPFDLQARMFTFVTAAVSVVITASLLWFFVDEDRYFRLKSSYGLQLVHLVGILALAMVVTWLVARLGLKLANWFLTQMPLVRRRIRPWLRKRGVRLLPPRKRGEDAGTVVSSAEDEILVFHERHHRRLWKVWAFVKPWLKRAVAVAITVGIFAWILKPIFEKWTEVRALILQTSIPRLLLASAMFAFFLFAFRALVWRRILQGFGHTLPVAAAVRIWITSELSRYLPITGVVMQVVGRVYLIKPYGVRGSVCSVSQILELAIFLLANMLVAVCCLLYLGLKNLDGIAATWLYAASGLVPFLLVLLHPKIFYTIVNWVMQRLGKPALEQRLPGWQLVGLLVWNIVGLIWQSLALYLLLDKSLQLKIDWWWVLAGAYSLAWCAGFLAVWAPGGIGVRELVFVTAMQIALPDAIRDRFAQREVLLGFLAFLSVLLRVWTTVGEIMLAIVSYALDLRGALGLSDAPGRVRLSGQRV